MKAGIHLCLGALFCLIVSPATGQDSDFEVLLRKGMQLHHDSCLHYLRFAADIATARGDHLQQARVHEWMGRYWDTQAKYQRSLAHIDSALLLVDSTAGFYPQLLHYKGRYFYRLLRYDSAFHYYHLAAQKVEEVGKPYQLWSTYYELGELYSDLDDRQKADEYYTKALAITRSEHRSVDHNYALFMLANRYRDWGWDEQAANLQEEYLNLKQHSTLNILEDDEHILVPDNIKDPEEKKQDILRYLPYHEKNGNILSVINSFYQLGNLELSQGHGQRAYQYYRSAFERSKTVEDITLQYGLLLALYEVQKEAGNPQGALMAHEQMFALRDSMRNSEKLRQLQDLEVKYETRQKEQDLAIKELQLERSERTKILAFLALIGLAVIAALALIAVRTKQRSNKRLGEKNVIISQALKEKDILLREIHHRVKNNLQMISALLYLQSKSISDPTAQDAIRESQNRVQSMALLHQNLYQDEDLLGVEIKDYLDKLFDHLFATYNIEKERIALKKTIENVNLDVDTVVPLALIVNELVSNALKHAFRDGRKGEIDVTLSDRPDSLVLRVADNGIGLPQGFDAATSGNFGYKLINILTLRMGAEWEINHQEGTCIILNIHKKNAA